MAQRPMATADTDGKARLWNQIMQKKEPQAKKLVARFYTLENVLISYRHEIKHRYTNDVL